MDAEVDKKTEGSTATNEDVVARLDIGVIMKLGKNNNKTVDILPPAHQVKSYLEKLGKCS